jgi:hypothetical protein
MLPYSSCWHFQSIACVCWLAGWLTRDVAGAHLLVSSHNPAPECVSDKTCCVVTHFERQIGFVTEITHPCVHTCNGLFICQLYSLPNLLEETDCKEDTPLTLPFCIIRFLLTVDNSDMN